MGRFKKRLHEKLSVGVFLEKNKQTYLFIREVTVGLIASSGYMYTLSHSELENILFSAIMDQTHIKNQWRQITINHHQWGQITISNH